MKKNALKVSVIIPYYNADKWISRCLDSLLNQDMDEDEYEIIVVDDGSSEPTPVLDRYVDEHPAVKCLHQENARQGAARNKGMLEACGEYILFCDADDMVAPNMLGTLCDLASRNHLEVLFHNYLTVPIGAEPTLPKSQAIPEMSNPTTGLEYITNPPHSFLLVPWIYVINRNFLFEHNLMFPTDIIYREDSLFFLNMLEKAERVAHVDVDFYYYIQIPSSIVHQGRKKNAAGYQKGQYTYIEKLTSLIQNTPPIRQR